MNTTTTTDTLRSETIVGKTGKEIGTRLFIGAKSAKELKAAAIAAGLTGAAKRRFIHDGLTTPDGARRAVAVELVNEITAAGYSADTATLRRGRATIDFVKLPKVAAKRLTKAAKVEAEFAALRAEIDRLKALAAK